MTNTATPVVPHLHPELEGKDPAYPDPTPADLESPEFNAIWEAIKGWDVSRRPHLYRSYSGATGNDVMHILNALRKVKP